MNNSSLVGVGYTQTLRPGKDCHMNCIIHVSSVHHKENMRSTHLYVVISLLQNSFFFKAKEVFYSSLCCAWNLYLNKTNSVESNGIYASYSSLICVAEGWIVFYSLALGCAKQAFFSIAFSGHIILNDSRSWNNDRLSKERTSCSSYLLKKPSNLICSG